MASAESAALGWRSDFEARIRAGEFSSVSELRARLLESGAKIEGHGVDRHGAAYFGIVLPFVNRRLRLRFRRKGIEGADAGDLPSKGPSVVSSVAFDGYSFALKLAYLGEGAMPKASAVCRMYGGYYIRDGAHPLNRCWKFSRLTVENFGEDLFDDLVDALRSASVTPSDDFDAFQGMLTNALSTVRKDWFVHGLEETIYPIHGGAGAVISGDFYPGIPGVARSMQGVFLPNMRGWQVRSSAVALKNQLVENLGFSDEQVRIMEGEYQVSDAAGVRPVDTPSVSPGLSAPVESLGEDEDEASGADVYLAAATPLKKTDFDLEWVEQQIKGYSLYANYQPEGVRHLVMKTSALLADDMGLGKTRQAIVAADIVARAPLAANDEQVFVAGMVAPTDVRAPVLVVCPASLIINWSREISAVDPKACISEQGYSADASWVIVNYERLDEVLPHARRFIVMIVDEAHFLKELTSQRTRVAFDVGACIPHRYLLTATPILNRESELHTLLKLSGHPLGAMPLREFEKQFSGDQKFRRELNHQVGEWMLRRTKDLVLKHLKGKQRQIIHLGGTSAAKARYDAIANDASLTALPKINKLRQILEAIKIEPIMDSITDMGADDKAIVFCEFKQTVRDIKERLQALGIKAVTLVGTDSVSRRQRSVDAFQEDPEVRVFLTTTAAGGVGWNLTAANYVFFASLPWTAALKNQAEDRAYRNGQLRLVVVKIPLMEGTIDAALWTLLEYKESLASDVLEDQITDFEQAESAAMEQFALRLAA